MANFMNDIHQENISNEITQWFHDDFLDDETPARIVHLVNNRFMAALEDAGLTLRVRPGKFRTAMCEALCTLYIAGRTDRHMIGPVNPLPEPKNWTEEAEDAWNDYVHHIFDCEFWETFWKTFRMHAWEYDVSTWRLEFEQLMPIYIERNIDVLSDAGLMFLDNNGEIIDAMEHEVMENEDDGYDMRL